jgi:hypothetical protein
MGPDAFDRSTGIAVAPNGDVFVTDGHLLNQHNSARIVKFPNDGRFLKTWGHKGTIPLMWAPHSPIQAPKKA